MRQSGDNKVKIHSDSFFCIGKQHTNSGLPCQDYAHSGELSNGITYAVVSDGCSGSPETDIGSRYLAHWFKSVLSRNHVQPTFPSNPDNYEAKYRQEFVKKFVRETEQVVPRLPSINCLEATLMSAFIGQEEKVGYVLVQGDGFVAFKGKNGGLAVYEISWQNSTPPYLAYNVDKMKLVCHLGNLDANCLSGGVHEITEAGERVLERWMKTSNAVVSGGITFPFNLNDISFVAIFSDGVGTFPHRNVFQTIRDFMDFKTLEGSFIKRTCLGTLRKYRKEGLEPTDDFSMAALRFDHDNSESSTKSGSERADSIAA